MGWRITLEWSSKGGGETFGFKNSTRIKKTVDIKASFTRVARVSSAYERYEEFDRCAQMLTGFY